MQTRTEMFLVVFFKISVSALTPPATLTFCKATCKLSLIVYYGLHCESDMI